MDCLNSKKLVKPRSVKPRSLHGRAVALKGHSPYWQGAGSLVAKLAPSAAADFLHAETKGSHCTVLVDHPEGLALPLPVEPELSSCLAVFHWLSSDGAFPLLASPVLLFGPCQPILSLSSVLISRFICDSEIFMCPAVFSMDLFLLTPACIEASTISMAYTFCWPVRFLIFTGAAP